MNIKNPYYTAGVHVPGYPEEHFSKGLGRIYGNYFRGINAGLLYTLTQTPQKVDDIFARQNAVKDIIYHGAGEIFGFEEKVDSLLKETRSRDKVKVWKREKEKWSSEYREVPLVYDHRALHACVLKFQKLCSDMVSSLDSVESDLFLRIRRGLSHFTDKESDICKKWEREKRLLDVSEMPAFSFLQQDAWTHEVESIWPLGAIRHEDMASLIDALKSYAKNPQGTLEIHIGDASFALQFVDIPDSQMQLKRSGKTNPKRYLDYDLFLDITRHIGDVSDMIDKLKLYHIAGGFYQKLKKQKLPVCFPELRNEKILDVTDFYPLHALFQSPGKYVRNSLRIDETNPIGVVTGLNSGGKSSLLHTLHTIVELSRAGFPVPAEQAVVGNFDSVLHQEIVGENMGDHSSTFRSQTRAALCFLDKHQGSNIGIGFLDEALSGTDAETGSKAITEFLQILAQVIKKPTIIVTHCTPAAMDVQDNPGNYPGVKLYCFRRNEKNQPTFKLEPGIGLSEGEYILNEEGLSLEAFKRRKKAKKKTLCSGKKDDVD